jgi:hypothetical protein
MISFVHLLTIDFDIHSISLLSLRIRFVSFVIMHIAFTGTRGIYFLIKVTGNNAALVWSGLVGLAWPGKILGSLSLFLSYTITLCA